MIKVGVIGLGKMGISHCSILNAHPDVESVAVCDTSKFMLSAIARHSEMQCFKDYQKMIKEVKPDGVVIATPTKSHFEIAKFAMHNGCHVFVEKPLCLNARESEVLAELAKERQLVSQTGYHYRFLWTFQEVKKLLDKAVIGRVYGYLGEAYGPVVLKEESDTWRSHKKEGGGCLYDYAAHVINLVNFLLGMPYRVKGCVMQSIFSRFVEDAIFATLVHENDLIGRIAINWSDESYRKMTTQVTILGVKGKIIADSQEIKIYLNDANPAEGLDKGWNMKWLTESDKPLGFYLRGEEYSSQIDNFIECIKHQTLDNINSFENSMLTDKVIELVRKDAEKNGESSDE